jgi:anthranilate synthase component 2
MIILIDNYDSFTYNVYHYLTELNASVKIYRNDKISTKEIKSLKPQAIILSPGPCTPNEAGICLELINEVKEDFPILGICLGHQSIGQAFKGSIIKCSEIMHGKIDKIKHYNHPLFRNIEDNFKATRYHSLIIDRNSLSTDFDIIAENDKKIIMGIAHKKLPIYGLQFHPESIGTNEGKTILKNFLEIIKYEY